MSETSVQRAIRARLDRRPVISKRALALEAGVKPDLLLSWEKGRSTPRDFQLVKLAPHLGVTVDELRSRSPTTGGQAPLPSDVIALLRALADLGDLIEPLASTKARTPDLIEVLQDAQTCARRHGL